MNNLVELQYDARNSQEIENFEDIAKYIVPSPGDIPVINGIEIYGESIPLSKPP